MLSLLKKLSVALLCTSPVLSSPSQVRGTLNRRNTSLPLPVNIIHQFPKPTWVENLAVRSNAGGDILCTILSAPELYLVDPSTGSATLLYSFPSVAGVLGIAQLGHDIFYVAVGNFSTTTLATAPGSFKIFEVDIRDYDEHGVAGVQVREVVTIKEALLLNGVTRLDSASKTLLIADTFLGGVWEVDVTTGAYTLGIDIPEMKAIGGPLGVNGIKVKHGYLYFTSGAAKQLSRVAIDKVSGAASGPVEVLASGVHADDFAIGKGGLVWIAQNTMNTLSVVLKNGSVVDVAGSRGSLSVPGPTACQFGRGDKLYCSTTGGLASRVNGSFIGGQILEVDTKAFYF